VYCATRGETERLAEALKAIPLEAAAYHAGLGRELRHQILEDYLAGRLTAIAATNAFGMGVDKPDIRRRDSCRRARVLGELPSRGRTCGT
jgi:ATP-dependent DNA helicase RecQ